MSTKTLKHRTIVMSGGSRGIGLAIARRAAKDGANIVLLAKTDQPHPRLPGTVHSAVDELQALGARAVAVVGDVRRDLDVERAVATANERFGGVDIVVNNASALDTSPTREISMKSYDLLQDVNVRGAFLLSKFAIPSLVESPNPHILTLSPPIDLRPRWAGAHLAYTISKYGMSLITLGLAEELRNSGVAANSLWPRTTIATAAVKNLVGGESAVQRARRPEIVADAAYEILTRASRECTGNFFIDEEVLRDAGIEDFQKYRAGKGHASLQEDIFLDRMPMPYGGSTQSEDRQ